MIVRDLRNIINEYIKHASYQYIDHVDRVRLGHRLYSSVNKKENLITAMVAKGLMDANKPLLDSSEVRLPVWMNKEQFDVFIFKIKYICQY